MKCSIAVSIFLALRSMDIVCRVPSILARVTNFVTSCLFSCTPAPFRKGIYSQREKNDSEGSKFIPF